MTTELKTGLRPPGTQQTVRIITWRTIHEEHAYMLPLSLLPKLGSKTLTLGYVMSYRNGLAHSRLTVATRALGLTRRTLREHLKSLGDHSLLVTERQGRNIVYKPTMSRESLQPCLYLPWFVAVEWIPTGRLPWSVRVIFAVVATEWCKLIRYAETTDQFAGEDPFEVVAQFDEIRHFSFSITQLTKLTGLSRRAVISARQMLRDLGVIRREPDDEQWFGESAVLMPNEKWSFRVLG